MALEPVNLSLSYILFVSHTIIKASETVCALHFNPSGIVQIKVPDLTSQAAQAAQYSAVS